MSAASHSDLTDLLERVARLETELAIAHAEIKRKDQIIAGLQHRLFGSSSEKLDPAQLQLKFDELVMGKPAPAGDTGSKLEKPKAARNRRTKAELFPKNLKIVIDKVLIPDGVDPDSADWKELDPDFHDELDTTKPEVFWRRVVLRKFVRTDDRSLPPVTAPAPPPSIPGTLCAPALAAQIITDKFEDHQPHYRQTKRFRRRQGVILGRQTLNTWTHATVDHLRPLGPAMKAEVLQTTYLQVDETPIDYLKPGHGATKSGFLWIYNDPIGRNCYYDWQLGRGHECMLDFLGYDKQTNTILFAGDIQCDGHSAYPALAKWFRSIRLAGCFAHIRRKFVEARDYAPENTLPILRFIQHIYLIEHQTRLTEAPPACRELIRRSRSRPIADELHRFIIGQRSAHLPHGKLGEALTYAINQWDKFLVCLENGRLEIDNNLAENKVRPTKLGARNWMFFGNAEAGVNNALLYTIMANCKNHGLDPEMYLTEVIKRLPHNATAEQAAELTPARFAAELAAAAVQAQTDAVA